jgi:hypothetical protein
MPQVTTVDDQFGTHTVNRNCRSAQDCQGLSGYCGGAISLCWRLGGGAGSVLAERLDGEDVARTWPHVRVPDGLPTSTTSIYRVRIR